MEKNEIPQELQESLKRYRELLGYDVEKGKLSLTERNHKPYLDSGYTDYADDTEDKENPDFDFGGEGDKGDTAGEDKVPDFDFGDAGKDSGEEGGDNADFDFGGDTEGDTGEEGGNNADFDFGGDTEEETDEFGTADEFSAADDIETDEDGDVEEIDVTDIVKRADDAKDYAEKAVSAAEEGTSMIKDLMGKFQELEKSLGAINTIGNEVTSIKKDLQAQKPKEKLELRSLDSYPFNVKLTDYWNDEKLKDNYEITDGSQPDAQSPDGQVNVWKVTPEDTKNWNQTDIQKSFIPESGRKKKVLSEINKGKLGSYISTGIAMAAVITLGVSVSDVDVTNADGSTRNAEIGETFTGVIEDMGETNSAGIVITVKTDKGETVEFHYYSTAYNFKIGSKVKLKIEKDKTFYFMPDVKMSNESRNRRKRI